MASNSAPATNQVPPHSPALDAGLDQAALSSGEDQSALSPGDDADFLPDGHDQDLSTLEASQDTDKTTLPAGYEVMVSDDNLADQTQAAAEFGDTLVAVQNVIQRYSQQFDALQKQIKEVRETLRNVMDNDEELQQLEAQAKTATGDLKMRKQRVKESPEFVQFSMKLKELGDERKEIEETLNGHLLRYYNMTGSTVIEEADGTEREFKINARLKGKKANSDE